MEYIEGYKGPRNRLDDGTRCQNACGKSLAKSTIVAASNVDSSGSIISTHPNSSNLAKNQRKMERFLRRFDVIVRSREREEVG